MLSLDNLEHKHIDKKDEKLCQRGSALHAWVQAISVGAQSENG